MSSHWYLGQTNIALEISQQENKDEDKKKTIVKINKKKKRAKSSYDTFIYTYILYNST